LIIDSSSAVAVLVAAYRAAARGAENLRGALVRAGLAEAMLFITASVGDGGEPVVHLTVTVAGVDRLARRLSQGGGGPPGKHCDGSGAA